MKTLCISILLLGTVVSAFCIDLIQSKHLHPVLQNVRKQTGYGLLFPDTEHEAVELTDEITAKLQNGLKSFMSATETESSNFWQRESTSDDTTVMMNVSALCLNDTFQLFRDFNKKQYAKDMFDADGKPGAGITHGNFYWLGNKKECSEANAVKFKGQMCTVVTNGGIPTANLFLTIGVCLPDSCTETDVIILSYQVLVNLNLKPLLVSCPDTLKYSKGDIIALVVCGIIGLAVLVGTLADVIFMYMDNRGNMKTIHVRSDVNLPTNGVNYENDGTSDRLGLLSNIPLAVVPPAERRTACKDIMRKILISFSLITNTQKLFNTKTATGSLTAVNGMRVISMWWVILGHTYAFNYNFMDNLLDFVEVVKRFTFQAVMNGTYSVDSFFFMSGLLVAYVTIKKMRGDEKINWAMFYFHRFWRLTPVYAIAIMIWATLYKHWIWNGDFSIGMEKVPNTAFDYCDKYWWTNILYINNFHPSLGNIEKQCMGWGWYLANDMQFYILSPIFLILLHKRKYIGHSLMLFALFGCIASRLVTADYYGMRLPGINQPINHTDEAWAGSSPLYNKPYARIAPYLVGIWLGYLLAINSTRVRLGKISLLIGWCVAIAIGMSVIYGLYHFYEDGILSVKIGGKTESLFYIGLSRFAWSISLAWVIYVCAKGKGGPVNSFLSWKVWAPLGRLTYCAYIVHPAVLFYFALNMEKSLHYTDLVMIQLYVSGLVISYCVAFILSMTVEAPMLALEKVIFLRK